MSKTKMTWEKIRAEQAGWSDQQLECAIDAMMPEDIKRISDKFGKEKLTAAEQRRFDEWENSEDSGTAGSIMSGRIK